jgi:PKD repeat protein
LTASPASGTVPLLVTFDGSGSTDSDGSIASYAFTFGDGASVTSASPIVTHTYTTAGNFSASLVVTDTGGASSTKAQTSIQVKANKAPKASLTASPTSGIAPQLVTFDGSGSTDSDRSIAAYAFNFGDGTSVTTASPVVTHTYTTAGNFSASLVVTDTGGASSTKAQTSIRVRANRPPAVAFRADPSSGNAPLTVKFTNQSRDPDGTIVAYQWSFGDGTTDSAQSPIHTYTRTGKFIVTLTVTDDKGASAQETGKVEVK